MADELSPQAAGNGQPPLIPICQCPNDAYKSVSSYAIDNSPTRPYHCPYTPTPGGPSSTAHTKEMRRYETK